MDAPVNVLADTYNVWVPIEDTDLMKSVEVDANGDWIVTGVMSSDDKDEEDDSITPGGMDCSYFLTKGWIKYEHGNNPNQFIGEPLEVRVGQFEHPTLRKSVNGIFVKGRLFQNRELAKQAVRAIGDLQKSHTKRTMGWSIEGNVKERDRATGKILKSILRNVVLTMNPVNTMTWAELAKSFASNHEVEVNMVEKAMDTAGMAEIMPQSLEGASHADSQEEWIRMFRKFVREHALQKSFQTQHAGAAGLHAYSWASQEGLDYDDACEFAAFVADRYETLKSLSGEIGGEKMSKEKAGNIAQLLDTELDELLKSIQLDDVELEEEELVKSQNGKDDEDSEKDNESDEDDEDSEKDDESDEDDEDSEKDDESDEDEKPLKKGLATDFAKSLAKDEGTQQAFDVSEFLASIADEIGFSVDGLQKSLTHVAKQQVATVNVLSKLGEIMKSFETKLDSVTAENVELRKSLEDALQRPVGRKGVVNQREVQTINKSMGAGDGKGEAQPLTRGRVMEVLEKSFDAGNMALGSEIMRFNAGVPVDKLALPDSIKSELGLV